MAEANRWAGAIQVVRRFSAAPGKNGCDGPLGPEVHLGKTQAAQLLRIRARYPAAKAEF